MTLYEWLMVGAAFLGVLISIIGAVIKLTTFLSTKFSEAALQRQGQIDGIRTYVTELLASHEVRDQDRHVENVERMTRMEERLEIIIKNGNGHAVPKRKRAMA